MSGLFDTLADAALGKGIGFAARPVSPFESVPDDGDPALEDLEDGPRPVLLMPDEKHAALRPNPMQSREATASDRSAAPAGRRAPVAAADRSREAPAPPPETLGRIAAERQATAQMPPRALTPQALTPRTEPVAAPDEMDARTPGNAAQWLGPAGPHESPDAEQSAPFAPLLPPVRQSAVELAAATSGDFGPTASHNAVKHPARTLTIGRIEVRPPPAPAPQSKAPLPTSTIARAMPRQSLDAYRQRKR